MQGVVRVVNVRQACQASHVPPQEGSGPDAKGVLRASLVHELHERMATRFKRSNECMEVASSLARLVRSDQTAWSLLLKIAKIRPGVRCVNPCRVEPCHALPL